MASNKLTIFLWFDGQAQEAADQYTVIFPNSKITRTTHYQSAGNGREVGSVMSVEFELNGQPFTTLNGGPMYKFSAATSFQISCEDQAETDYYWSKLSAGGDESKQRCGWVEDRFGVTWQVVPTAMTRMLREGSGKQASKLTEAFMKMKKLDVAVMKEAYDSAE